MNHKRPKNEVLFSFIINMKDFFKCLLQIHHLSTNIQKSKEKKEKKHTEKHYFYPCKIQDFTNI